jgi:hypothetical protein
MYMMIYIYDIYIYDIIYTVYDIYIYMIIYECIKFISCHVAPDW